MTVRHIHIHVQDAMSALQYAKQELQAGKFPDIGIYAVAGDFWLTDSNNNLLSDRPFNTRQAAIAARSALLDKARKAVNK